MSKTNNLTDFLTDLANGIRTAEGSTGTINPQDFRTRIENLASGSARPTLYGTYILASNPSFTVPTVYIKENFDGLEAYMWIYNAPEDCFNYLPIYYIGYSTRGTCCISSDETGGISIDYTRSGVWKANYEDYYDLPSGDERWRIIDFCQPVEVSQEFYDLFMLMVEGTGGMAYGIAYNVGQSEGLEALGALCDWSLTLDPNSFPIITIVNHHPSYYLHCDVYDDIGNSVLDYETDDPFVDGVITVAPNSYLSLYIDGVPKEGNAVLVENVRWSANA